MDDDITRVLQALETDSVRCPVHPASAIRRRGDRRRVTVRVAATGGTVALVGVSAGTAFAVAQQPSPSHDMRVGIAGNPGSTSHRNGNQRQTHKLLRGEDGHAGTATPTPTPTGGASTPMTPPTPPGNTGTPTPTGGYRGSTTPTASPTPTSS
jgi:hypothetical protein